MFWQTELLFVTVSLWVQTLVSVFPVGPRVSQLLDCWTNSGSFCFIFPSTFLVVLILSDTAWGWAGGSSSSSSSVFYDSSRNQRRWRAVYTFTTLPHASLPSPHLKAICFEVFLTKKTRSLRIDSPFLSSVFLPASSSFVQVHRCHLSLLYPHGGSEWNFIFRCYSRVNLRPGRTVEQYQSCTVPGQGRQSHGAFLVPGSSPFDFPSLQVSEAL